jgi:beta-1,4-mannosyltransferase
MTVQWITLNDFTKLPKGAKGLRTTILHGHYRDVYPSVPIDIPVRPTTLLYFGRIRPFKGVEHLIAEFGSIEDDTLELRVLGLPISDAYGALIRQRVATDPRVFLELQHIAPHHLSLEIATAQAVVLPYLQPGNSGSALLALSLGCPIVAPSTPITRALQDEVGSDWLVLYEGSVSAAALLRALQLRRDRLAAPNLEAREWTALGQQLEAVYKRGRR